MTNPSVGRYLAERLSALGIDSVFGVPGDYAFSFDDAVEECPTLKWVGCANELNASYAADGYARRIGAAVLSTTYGVGELSALNGMMGCLSQRVPVFHVVGAPSRRITHRKLITHHTLGDGEFGNFESLSAAACCVSTVLTPQNAIAEIERVIVEAIRQARPAYIVIPMDTGRMPVVGTPPKGRPLVELQPQPSVPVEVNAAVTTIVEALKTAKSPIALPAMLVQRYGLKSKLAEFLTKSNLPFALTPMDKGLISESHSGFIGMYNGASSTPKTTQSVVESADLILDFGGVIFEDINTGLWSGGVSPERIISIHDTWVQFGDKVWVDTSFNDILDGLIAQTPTLSCSIKAEGIAPLAINDSTSDALGSDAFYPRLQKMLRYSDVLIAETGSCMLRLGSMGLPEGVGYESQVLWGSIGWATPACLGVAMANKAGRTVLVTGDGAHQQTYNEIAVMGRYKANVVIFVLNNNIFGIEDVLSEMGHVYDDLAPVNYHMIPEAMGCKGWNIGRVKTVGELNEMIARIQQSEGPAYVEVMIPAEESQPLPDAVKENLYKLSTPAA